MGEALSSVWPEGKQFAFTVFDDTDSATVANVAPVYALLAERGFRTTKSVWVVEGGRDRGLNAGESCENLDYLNWVRSLQAQGFEIGYHNATWHGLPREQVRAALDKFAQLFGHDPLTAANHTGVEESIYWADARLSGWRRGLYNVLTRFRNYRRYRGHVEGDAYFWGDLCRERIRFFRNFTFTDINTLKACPFMPYHDPLKPYVNYWFASSDGNDVDAFNRCLAEENQDRLEAEGGACIMYSHFAKGFAVDGRVNARCEQLLTRMARKNGWFVPVGELLGYLLAKNGAHQVTDGERRRLEWKWLQEKFWIGTN
jgi:hypothetical protein